MTFPDRFLLLSLILLSAAVLFSGGCYDRFTGNYDEIPELVDIESEVENPEEEAKKREEQEAERIRILEELEQEKEQVYTINSGDNVEIIVYNHEDLTIKTTVTPDGHIGMVFIGQVKVAGLTLEQASRLIEEKLSKYIRNPKVGISPYEIRSETVTIAGAVAKPGMYDISNGMRLADLFAKAGGAATRYFDGQTLDATNFEKSIFLRRNKIVPLNFEKAIVSGQAPDNVLLRKGDYIYIAQREDAMVYVIGDAKKPSRHMWSKKLGLLELLSSSSWLNETHWSHVIIIRGSFDNPKMYKVDLDAILAGKKKNVALRPNDVVYVPHDNISEYNVFVRKLLPTGQLLNMLTTPFTWASGMGR